MTRVLAAVASVVVLALLSSSCASAVERGPSSPSSSGRQEVPAPIDGLDVRAMQSAQAAYGNFNQGYYDQLECVGKPAACLPGYPESDVGLDPRPDDADKAALRRFGLIMHGSDQNRPTGNGFVGGLFVAAGKSNRRQGQCRSS